MTDRVRVVECDDHVGQHVYREPDDGEPACTNPVDFPDFEHACTDLWSIGWYLCTCGEPWLSRANRCMTQSGPIDRAATSGSHADRHTGTESPDV